MPKRPLDPFAVPLPARPRGTAVPRPTASVIINGSDTFAPGSVGVEAPRIGSQVFIAGRAAAPTRPEGEPK